MTPDTDKRLLLEQLRIDPGHRESGAAGSRPIRWLVATIVGVLVLVAAGAGYYLLRGQSIAVDAATAAPPAASTGGSTAILQATGYVTARRQATVSAQITGALKEVLIEEGERVTS